MESHNCLRFGDAWVIEVKENEMGVYNHTHRYLLDLDLRFSFYNVWSILLIFFTKLGSETGKNRDNKDKDISLTEDKDIITEYSRCLQHYALIHGQSWFVEHSVLAQGNRTCNCNYEFFTYMSYSLTHSLEEMLGIYTFPRIFLHNWI